MALSRVALSTGPTVTVEDTGGDGPVIVFSHGFLLDHRMFAPQLAALPQGWRGIAWDERGHGGTEYDGAPFTYWDSARDLLALLDALGVERAVLVGMSQGGFLSLRAALLAPERVVALVLIDSQAGLEDPASVPLYEAMKAAWEADGLSDELAEAVFAIIASPDRALWQGFADRAQERDAGALDAPFRALVDRDDLTPRLAEITCPALVIHGDADAAIPLDRARSLAGGLPGAGAVEVVAGGAHASNLSHPEAVNAAILSFLTAIT